MKLSDAQFCALTTVRDHGPVTGTEVAGPQSMDGKRSHKLECHVMNKATLAALSADGLVAVSRSPLPRRKNAVGKVGHPRTAVKISITEKGREALNN